MGGRPNSGVVLRVNRRGAVHLVGASNDNSGSGAPFVKQNIEFSCTITLGVAGTVYTDALSCLRALQLASSVIESVVRSWVHMTLNLTHGLVVQRRQLDGHYINKAFSQPP